MEIIDIDDYYIESTKESESINKKVFDQMCEIEKLKETLSKQFQQDIISHYENQEKLVDEKFRELHDLLHIKQVDVKRELKSHLDENTETHVLLISQLEHQILQLKKSIDIHNSDVQQPQQSLEDKIKTISNYTLVNNSNSNAIGNSNNNIAKLKQFSVIDGEFGSLQNSISNMKILSERLIDPQSPKTKRYRYLYIYSTNIFELSKIDLDGVEPMQVTKTQLYNHHLSQQSLLSQYQSINSFENFNLFTNNSIINIKNGTVKQFYGIDVYSSVSDDSGNIYFTDKSSNIYKMAADRPDIYKKIGSLYKESGVHQTLSWGRDGYLYITTPIYAKVHRMHPDSGKIEEIANPIPQVRRFVDPLNTRVTSTGVYSPKYHQVFYICEKKPLFVCYDIESKQTTELPTHKNMIPLSCKECKLLHDNDDHLYLFILSKSRYFKYNIAKKEWNEIQTVHKCSQVSAFDIFVISN
ncbi:hypothetical protein DLAC_10231 [Tieghemostelium lacteum]|uniref:Uncharacterized protein n=1 Tax=Tieghemostelium lacteum TaxID=361077 RepID=A0A151Z4Y9_TIELA|nr:hypothetical protein DLAC_10231 [Tieghemostelium lacteum]|eukprot:KYQ89011.1 hypothetical protein DLAC_10231 [Tieghemostelium lacteum]